MSLNCLECLNAKFCPVLSFILAHNEETVLSVQFCKNFQTLVKKQTELQNNPTRNLADRIHSIKQYEEECRKKEEPESNTSICEACKGTFPEDEMTYSLFSNRLLCEECYDKEGEDEAE